MVANLDWVEELAAQLDTEGNADVKFLYDDGTKTIEVDMTNVQFEDDIIVVHLAPMN